MKKVTFKSYEELPMMLSVLEMAAALGISSNNSCIFRRLWRYFFISFVPWSNPLQLQ